MGGSSVTSPPYPLLAHLLLLGCQIIIWFLAVALETAGAAFTLGLRTAWVVTACLLAGRATTEVDRELRAMKAILIMWCFWG